MELLLLWDCPSLASLLGLKFGVRDKTDKLTRGKESFDFVHIQKNSLKNVTQNVAYINHLRLNRGKGLWPLGWDSQVLTRPGVAVWQRAAMSAANSWSYLRLQFSSSYRSIFKRGNFHCNYSIKNAFTRGEILTLVSESKGKVKNSNCFEFKITHMPPKHILGDISGTLSVS